VTAETVDYATGELVAVDTSSEIAVTSYLQQARDWLATAVEQTGPEQIAMTKAEIATAAEATKQLGLSKEIQDDAKEMVRRAEYALRKAQLRGQEAGEIRSRETNLRTSGTSTSGDLPKPRDFFSSEVEYRDSLAMGALEDHEFEQVLSEAREEGNLSRQNVANKARSLTGPKQQRTPRRRPLTDVIRDVAYDLEKVAERLERIAADDRFRDNRDAIADLARGRVGRSVDLIQKFQTAINDEAAPKA